jgi:1,4-alpha-glucan branching enzyme
MRNLLHSLLVFVVFGALVGVARAADDAQASAILEKAIKALGGEEKLAKAKAITWKSKGTISFGDNDNPFTGQTTLQGIDHLRGEFEADFGGQMFKGVTVVAGDKGWRSFADMISEMDKDALQNEKRMMYLQFTSATLMPLKQKEFKLQTAADEQVAGKPAAALKVTGPDGKDFTLYFDKQSSLPVKQVAKVIGFMGEEFTQETTYDGYKDFDGIKKATKIEAKRDGQKFIEQEITDFKVLEKADAATFSEPK